MSANKDYINYDNCVYVRQGLLKDDSRLKDLEIQALQIELSNTAQHYRELFAEFRAERDALMMALENIIKHYQSIGQAEHFGLPITAVYIAQQALEKVKK